MYCLGLSILEICVLPFRLFVYITWVNLPSSKEQIAQLTQRTDFNSYGDYFMNELDILFIWVVTAKEVLVSWAGTISNGAIHLITNAKDIFFIGWAAVYVRIIMKLPLLILFWRIPLRIQVQLRFYVFTRVNHSS